MLAGRAQPVVKLDVGGAPVGLGEGAGFQLHQRRGFLRPGRQDAARAVIFEAAADQPYAIRQESRGQRVARMALILAVVETETQSLLAVDSAAARQTEGLRHGDGSRAGGGSPMR